MRINFKLPGDKETQKKWAKACAAEFLGTAILTFFATEKAVITTTDIGGAPINPEDGVITSALASGFSLAALVYSLAKISGGHINPAVTWAMILSGNMPMILGLLYFVAQILGGIAGAGFLAWFAGYSHYRGVLSLHDGVTPSEGFGTEAFLTFLFVFVIFNTVVYADRQINTSIGIDRQRNLAREAIGPFIIGLTLATCYLVAGPVTGAGINPARAFGAAVVGRTMKDQWLYWFGPFFGASIAPVLFYGMRKDVPAYTLEEPPEEKETPPPAAEL